MESKKAEGLHIVLRTAEAESEVVEMETNSNIPIGALLLDMQGSRQEYDKETHY